MLEQNDTLERMVILLDAIIERVSANDSSVADEYPKGQSMDTGYSAHSSFRFFAKSIIFRSLFLLGCCLCVSLPSTIEGGLFQYRLRSSPYICKRFWEAQTKNNVKRNMATRSLTHPNTKCELLNAVRNAWTYCVSVRKKKHPLPRCVFVKHRSRQSTFGHKSAVAGLFLRSRQSLDENLGSR